MTRRDSIFALSSGAPPAGIGVIRVSGPQARPALLALAGRVPPARQASLALLRDPQDAMTLDRARILWLPGPATVTGEDMVELHCHGGRAVIAAVEAALGAIESRRAFFIAVDLVDPDEGLVAELLEASAAAGCLGAVPRCRGITKGAFAVYSSDLLIRVSSLLDGGEARLQSLAGIEGVSVVEVEEAAGDVFSGLNTPAEYEAARSRVEDGAG